MWGFVGENVSLNACFHAVTLGLVEQYALQNKTYKNITVYEKLNAFNPSYTINIFFFCYRVILLSCSNRIPFLDTKKCTSWRIFLFMDD